MLNGDGDRLRLHGVNRSLRRFRAVGVGDHHNVGANFLRKGLELRVQGCGFIRRHLRAGSHDRRRDIVRDQAIAIGQRLGRSAGDTKLRGRLDEGGTLLAHLRVEHIDGRTVVAHRVGVVACVGCQPAQVLPVGAASLRVGVERLAVLLDLRRGLLQRCDPLVVGGLLAHDRVRSGALSVVDSVDRVHEPEMRVESVTGGLRSLGLSLGLSLSSSSPSVVRASLSCGGGGSVTHRLLRLAERPIQAGHRHRKIVAGQFPQPVRGSQLLHLGRVLGEPLHKRVHRHARLERFIAQLREDARRVAHAELCQPGVDVRQLLVEAIHLALGASKAGNPRFHGVGEPGAADIVRRVRKELHRR